jgi:hypothetical protein
MLFPLLLLAVCVPPGGLVRASSSAADIYVCRADADNLGCSSWATMDVTVCPNTQPAQWGSLLQRPCETILKENRGACLDQPAAALIMPWTGRPVLSSAYSLFATDAGAGASTAAAAAADAITSYVPGAWMTVVLRTLEYKKKYRGLLLHADDADNNNVGAWGLPESTSSSFWHPPVCGPKVVLHSGASLFSSFLVLDCMLWSFSLLSVLTSVLGGFSHPFFFFFLIPPAPAPAPAPADFCLLLLQAPPLSR